MRRIDTLNDIKFGLDALVALEPRLAHVAGIAGDVPLRRHPAGFESLAGIIVSQQISKASADAIFGRLKAAVDPFTPERLLDIGEGGLAGAGLSRPKQKTFLAVAEACRSGLDLAGLCERPAARCHRRDDGHARHRALDGRGLSAFLRRAPGHFSFGRHRFAERRAPCFQP